MLDFLIILILGFVPMLLYGLILWWFDRYEKEPLPLLVGAFMWGAIPSIIVALILQIILDIPIVALSPNQLTYDLVGASIVAPITEEGIKALAIIVLLIILRREIDSPMDGLIYGGLVGFGFAAVENVFYFLGAYSMEGLAGAVVLAVLRAGIFGLNHAMYTGFTGVGVALSLEVEAKWLKPILVFVGLTLAIVTHALHNALATFTGYAGSLLTLLAAILVDWLGVIILIIVAVWSFYLERKRIVAYAEELAKIQRLSHDEIDILKSAFRRRITRLKLLFSGNIERWWQTQRFHHEVTKAAFAWHRMNHGDINAQKRLQRLEAEFLRLHDGLSGNRIAPR